MFECCFCGRSTCVTSSHPNTIHNDSAILKTINKIQKCSHLMVGPKRPRAIVAQTQNAIASSRNSHFDRTTKKKEKINDHQNNPIYNYNVCVRLIETPILIILFPFVFVCVLSDSFLHFAGLTDAA